MEHRIKVAEHILKYGSQLILEAFHTSIYTKEKTRHDYVTEIDQRIENLVDSEIKKIFLNDAILGEENEIILGTSEYLWVLDPLDGTNNFVKGIPQAGIQIAIYKDNRIIYGGILNPFVGQLYTATKDGGAYVEDITSERRARMRVPNNQLEDSMLIYDAGIATGETSSKKIFNSFLGNVGWIRIFGVAVLDLPLIALGSADILVSNIPKPMDIAPGCLLIEEAGGIVTDFMGNPWSLDSKGIIASNIYNHPEALAIINNNISTMV